MIAAALAACGWSCNASGGWADYERMLQQRRADSYEANEFFADGMVMRRPPAGTVTWQEPDLEPGPATPKQIADGRHHFRIYCAVCHGADASGRSVMAGNMPGPAPPSLLTAQRAAYPAEFLFELISNGRNRMPAYDWALSTSQRWAVIAYLGTLPQTQAHEHEHEHEQ